MLGTGGVPTFLTWLFWRWLTVSSVFRGRSARTSHSQVPKQRNNEQCNNEQCYKEQCNNEQCSNEQRNNGQCNENNVLEGGCARTSYSQVPDPTRPPSLRSRMVSVDVQQHERKERKTISVKIRLSYDCNLPRMTADNDSRQ